MSLVRRMLQGIDRRDLMSSAFTDPNRIPLNSEGGATYTGFGVTPESSLRISTVYACVRLVSQTIAALPVATYRRSADKRLELDLPPWLEQPNPDFNRFEFFEQVMTSLLLWGNAYVIKILDEGFIAELWPVNPAGVRIENRNGRRVYIVHRGGQIVGEFDRDEVLHIRGFSMPGSVVGLSPIDHARQTIGLAAAAEEYGGRFFNNDATPGGVIEFPGNVEDPVLKRTAVVWKQMHQGASRSHEPGFLFGGAKWQSITIPNDSAQFIETRKFGVSEIARWFGVQPHKVGDLERATFSNIEHQAIEWVVDGVLPWLVRLEFALNPLLGRGVFPDRRTNAFVKWNVDGLLRGDSASRAAFYNIMRYLGVYNADEIRALEDEEPIPGGLGQTYWQPSNIVPAGTQPPEPTAPAPAPEPALPAVNGNGTAERVARLLAAAKPH